MNKILRTTNHACPPKSWRRRKPRTTPVRRNFNEGGKHAFTLVEVIIVMAILTIFITSLFTVFKNSLDSWKKSEARLAIYQNARAILDQMSREIPSVLIDTAEGIKFRGFAAGSGKGSSKDEIYFVASLENDGRYDLCTVGYWLDEDDKELMRYYQVDTVGNSLDFDFDNLDSGTIGQRSDQLGLNVMDLQFKFRYRDSGGDWPTTTDADWDSSTDNVPNITNYTATGIEKNPHGLPNGVYIEITVQDPSVEENPEDKDLYTFSTIVYIPQAK